MRTPSINDALTLLKTISGNYPTVVNILQIINENARGINKKDVLKRYSGQYRQLKSKELQNKSSIFAF